MDAQSFEQSRRFVETSFGRIAYVERGEGPVTLFFHGAFLNGYQWRDVIEQCADVRRCIAFDNMGHGHTEIGPDQPVDFAAQAAMAAELVDRLGADQVDLVGNDSGGGIAQVFAAGWPDRMRTITLTNCDVHTNSPPADFVPTIDAFRAGVFPTYGSRLLDDIELARSARGFGKVYESPDRLSPSTLQVYLAPLLSSPEKVANFERFVLSLEPKYTVEIEERLKKLDAPTLIAWGTADHSFPLEWAYWLADTIPAARPVVEIEGAKLFWPEERPDTLSALLHDLWATVDQTGGLGGGADRGAEGIEPVHTARPRIEAGPPMN